MTTIADVAERAGVSIATVSRVINGSRHVTSETCRSVLQAAKELDYHPNQPARNLRQQRTGAILILTPNMTNPFYASILTGVGDTAAASGFAAFICNTGDDPARATAALDRLSQRQADGAIVLSVSQSAEWLPGYAARFPIVQCAEFVPDPGIARVSIDNYAASRDIMAYLLGLRHERIAHISADNPYQSTSARLSGYRDAMAEAGLPVPSGYVIKASPDYSFSSGKRAAWQLLTAPSRPTAIYCISDTLALGAVVAAQELGLRVPDDVTITGFDNVMETEMIRPHLTTLAQPCYDLGRTAMQTLDDLVGRRPTTLEHVLEHRLVIRESSSTAPEPSQDHGAPPTSKRPPTGARTDQRRS